MNPDIDLRLDSITKALADVILPALPQEQRFARDQLGLVLGHLRIIAAHWKHALRYELACCDALCGLARELAGLIDDPALRDAIDAAVACAASVDRSDYARVSAALHALGTQVDRAISAGYTTAPLDSRVTRAVIAYAAAAAPRARIWHRDSGLDPDAAALPSIAALFPSSTP
jgi:hypothetical protein